MSDRTKPEHTPAKGFDNWVEVFEGGQQTDSKGVTREFTDAQLDEVVANHKPAPIVIGHPKTDSPAYGWTESLRRVGKKLEAKFGNVQAAFAKMVEDKRFPNRSVKFRLGPKGLELVHVGWLGAAPPAIEGLKPVEFAAGDDGMEFEFAAREGYALRLLAGGLRRMREFLLVKFGQEEADAYAPDYQISELERLGAEIDDTQRPLFAAPQPKEDINVDKKDGKDKKGDDSVQTFSQADIDNARQEGAAAADTERKLREKAEAELAEFRRGAAKTKAENQVKQWVETDRKLTPAQAEGLAEFMAALGDELLIEFSAHGAKEGDAPVKVSQAEFIRRFVDKLVPKIEFGRHGADVDPSVDVGDTSAILASAQEYQRKQAEAGHVIDIARAINHIKSQAAK